MKSMILIGVGVVTTCILAFVPHDSKSKLGKVLFWLSLMGTIAVIVISGMDTLTGEKELSTIKSDVTDAGKKIQDLERERTDLQAAIAQGSERLQSLESEKSKLNDSLTASSARIASLEDENRRLTRGEVDMWEFDGTRRQTTKPGHINLDTSGQAIYGSLTSLHDQRKWAELLQLCERQFKERPRWLTPYLYAAFAYANLGNNRKAIELSEHVVSEADGNPQYKEASRLLSVLKK